MMKLVMWNRTTAEGSSSSVEETAIGTVVPRVAMKLKGKSTEIVLRRTLKVN